jgi:hypothetical protein
MTNVSEAMRTSVGRELGRRVSYPVTDSDIRRWAIAVHYPEQPPARYWDDEHGEIVAPLDFNPFAWLARVPGFTTGDVDANDPDRTEKTLGIAGPGLTFQLNGGMSVSYGVRMRPDDVITSVSRLAGYHERTGRLGLMLMSTTEDTWTNQRGETVKKQAVTLIRY